MIEKLATQHKTNKLESTINLSMGFYYYLWFFKSKNVCTNTVSKTRLRFVVKCVITSNLNPVTYSSDRAYFRWRIGMRKISFGTWGVLRNSLLQCSEKLCSVELNTILAIETVMILNRFVEDFPERDCGSSAIARLPH